MRIAWYSNAPWASTGYGIQTRLFTERIKRLGHEVAILANWGLEAGIMNLNGIPVYPKGHTANSIDVIGAHAAHFQADVLISLYDAWVLEPAAFQGIRWAPWFPVDQEPAPAAVVRQVRQAWQPLVYSRFAERMMAEQGITATYIPHGVDTKAYRPGDRAQARERLGWSKDAYIVGMVAANKGYPPRKAFAQNMLAFKRFSELHPDALLYLHTTTGKFGEMGGMNLPEYAEYLGIEKRVIWADQYNQLLGLKDDTLATIYQAMDILLAVSMGEGFGVPILEAQACGVPVVVGGWTSMPELLFAGAAVDKRDSIEWWTPGAGNMFLPRPEAILEALGQVRATTQDTAAAVERAREYDADHVTRTYWKPALEAMESRIRINQQLMAGVR